MDDNIDNFNEYEKKYEILQNDLGEVLVIIGFREDEPVEPKIIYDGGASILLYRSPENSVFLTHVSDNARHPVQYASKITIAEVKFDEVMREYIVPVYLIKDMKDILN